ncbi:hypothetical protein AOQ84DRAFT_366099 [Glonium stellatum]|uniref:Uncharacterized protein n=1 Tax=Glonium stellatum TaxID=574774 RepID=A0A8E2EWA2_9PEZI|nr:hypothetical protein AOQ84DRAFT_366099 [Glonium stellatum]
MNASKGNVQWFRYETPICVDGSISCIAGHRDFRGDRCTDLTIFQMPDNGTIIAPSLFQWNSTLDPIVGNEDGFQNLRHVDCTHIYGSDDFTRICAGAISWTGYTMNQQTTVQTTPYLVGSPWNLDRVINVNDIQNLIPRFSISALAALNDNGPSHIVLN